MFTLNTDWLVKRLAILVINKKSTILTLLITFQEKFGGHGYKHILTVTVPKMLAKGIPQKTIDKILINNPAEILTFYHKLLN